VNKQFKNSQVLALPKLKDKMSRFFEDKNISQENILALHLHLKALKNSTDARRDEFRDKVMTMLRQFVVSYSIRLIPRHLQNLKIFSFLQDVPSDDEPAPLVGEKRVRDDDDDPLFATGTQTGTGDENQNDENEDGTRTEEVEEEKNLVLLLLYSTKHTNHLPVRKKSQGCHQKSQG
jgi:hypothetical protein